MSMYPVAGYIRVRFKERTLVNYAVHYIIYLIAYNINVLMHYQH